MAGGGRRRERGDGRLEIKYNPLRRFAPSPFSRLRREGGHRQRGGAALARRSQAWAAPVLSASPLRKYFAEIRR
ncbi:hypothetical protein EAG14_11675 [Acidovorax sp. 1608163]|nr:hypothetical protein EAG14_11675 [Acidovorax sp. 1608163]